VGWKPLVASVTRPLAFRVPISAIPQTPYPVGTFTYTELLNPQQLTQNVKHGSNSWWNDGRSAQTPVSTPHPW